MPGQRENVLLILVDQWPAWAFGHRGADVATPHLDRLAETGTLFTNAFTTCPLCTPARGALLTARLPHRTGVHDNSAVGYSIQASLPLEQRTWLDEAVRRGRQVGYFGKWHLGRVNPEARGAHACDPSVEVNARPYDPERDDFSYERARQQYERQAATLLAKGRASFWGELADPAAVPEPFRIMERGVRFLEAWAGGDRAQPFLLTLSSNPPHFPHYLPAAYARAADRRAPHVRLPASLSDGFAGKPPFHARPWWPCMDTSCLDEAEWRTVIAYSQAHLSLVDEAIGRVLAALARLGLAESTTVVFVADHGDMQGAHNRFDKGPYFYDEVWRIPLIIRRPGTPPATQDAMVSILDLGATLFGLVDAPDGGDRPRDGRDLCSLVGGGARPDDWPQTAYGVYDLYNGMSFAARAIRDERWSYVWNPQSLDELYDHHTDPAQMTNLAGRPEHAEIRERLRGRLMAWLRETGDPLPERAAGLPPAGTILATGRPGP